MAGVFDPDLAAMGLDDSLSDGQSQAGAAPLKVVWPEEVNFSMAHYWSNRHFLPPLSPIYLWPILIFIQ